MLTMTIVNNFDREIRKWRDLSTEEQDNVISQALERCYARGMHTTIYEPMGWLLRAARLIKLEELRRRKEDRKRLAEFCERWTVDRWLNGKPIDREPNLLAVDTSHNDSAEPASILAIRDALESLTANQRQVVELCFLGDLMPADAGRRLSMERSTTKSHLVRARNKLRSNSTLRAIASRSNQGKNPRQDNDT